MSGDSSFKAEPTEVVPPATAAVETTRAGTAPIKAQYLKANRKRPAEEVVASPAANDAAFEAIHDTKRLKGEETTSAADDHDQEKLGAAAPKQERGRKDKKRRGQNKGRERAHAGVSDEIRLCAEIAQGKICHREPNCRYSHDVAAYVAIKGPDLGTECPVFNVYGKCKFGVKCRYGGAHTDANGNQVVDEEKAARVSESDVVKNTCDRDFQKKIRGRDIETPRTDAYMNWLIEAKAKRAEIMDKQNKEAAAAKNAESGSKEIDVATVLSPEEEEEQVRRQAEKLKKREERQAILDQFDHDPANIRFRCDRKKMLDFRGKTYLAPLTTVGNLPFRRVCKSFGVDITCGEMAMATNLLQGQQHEWALTKRHVSEDIFGVQIAGNSAQSILKCCESIKQSGTEVDFIDLNLGCPVDAITRVGAGSALLETRGKLYDICAGATYVLDDIPFTVKIRKGVYTNSPIAARLVPKFWECGVSMVSIHGRSKEQRYTKLADWDYISEIGSNIRRSADMKNLTFFGNGDVMSHEDYWQHLEQANVDGAMIGRGALIKPWLFTEIKERRVWDISSTERFDILKQFVNYGLEYWGSDTQGVNCTRRFLCEWMSFQYRYIPVGLLEVLPQKINDRPPPFYGRDELETLLASSNSEDWVKVTEMILGKAPESFQFIPKHKSNSYENDNYEG
ncbi:hypothetical protein PhCBS80983_g02196 [Powellomyces hirtus]|uniref:tRNA-dihydrouridine(47) synthase [NAD(P)(+)] n=1 Tax=Powellomyces hirtus TaxID=109895 RepID=A0A507E7J7_9FUNG|nr:hypothetical protein PhCBS80983_g02196 [Powellomyces hirtus]